MSNSHFEKAKDEASRLAKEMGAGVKEGLKEGEEDVSSKEINMKSNKARAVFRTGPANCG